MLCTYAQGRLNEGVYEQGITGGYYPLGGAAVRRWLYPQCALHTFQVDLIGGCTGEGNQVGVLI